MKLYAVTTPAQVTIGEGFTSQESTFIINKAHGTKANQMEPAVYTSKAKAQAYCDHMAEQYPDIGYKVTEIDGSAQAYGVEKRANK